MPGICAAAASCTPSVLTPAEVWPGSTPTPTSASASSSISVGPPAAAAAALLTAGTSCSSRVLRRCLPNTLKTCCAVLSCMLPGRMRQSQSTANMTGARTQSTSSSTPALDCQAVGGRPQRALLVYQAGPHSPLAARARAAIRSAGMPAAACKVLSTCRLVCRLFSILLQR